MSEPKNQVDSQDIQMEETLTRTEKLAMEDAKHRRTAKIYGIATAVLAVAAVIAVIWNTGIIQGNTPAAVINGEDISVGELNYYYSAVLQEEMYNVYYGTSSYNLYAEADAQMYDSTRTYHDYFLEQSLVNLQGVYALTAAARSENFDMDEETLAVELVTANSELEYYALYNGFTDAEAYLQYNYGTYMTLEIFEKVYADQYLATAYASTMSSELEASDEELESYYEDNAGNLDTYTISYMVLLASQPTAGEGVTLTDEELAAGLAENVAIQATNADEILAALEDGEDFVTLGESYEVYGAYENDVYMGLNLNSSFAEWVQEDGRQQGDLTIATYEASDRVVYYVVRFEDRVRDDSATANIRHIFVSAGAAPTEEEYATAYETAADLLAQWEAGEATPESFGELAMLNSADSSSSTNGGILTGVSETSGYVDTFEEWCLDASRQPGDTELVINEGSSLKGWHVMYFESWGDPLWSMVAETTILAETLTQWYDDILASYPIEVGAGAKYIG